MNLSEMIVTDIFNIITVSSNKGRYEQMHNRLCYGISFASTGQITYIHNGKTFVSDKNSAVLLPKGQDYTIYGTESGDFPVINFECINFHSDEIFVFPIKNNNNFIKDFERMKNLFYTKNDKLQVMSILYDIISKLNLDSSIESNILAPAVKYIESNYFNDITNEELAKKCNISEVYFRKLFTKQYGDSPKKHIINLRINKAKQLLTEGVLQISAVAEECGFSNPYHFCRLFKQRTGLTPSGYMKQNKIYKI